jgi:hypothetical protein
MKYKFPILICLVLIACIIYVFDKVYASSGNKQPVVATISVKSFGAKGDGITDDAPAITKAILYCVKNKAVCNFPKTSKFYNISSTIRIPLNPGESINIISDGAIIRPLTPPINNSAYNLTLFKEHIFLSIGSQIDNLTSAMFSRSAGSAISIKGLTFDGQNLKEQFAPKTFDADIFIGLQVLSDKVTIEKCIFKNIFGYGLRVHNVKTSVIKNSSFSNVGGRGATAFAQKVDRDAFGDGLYHSLVKSGGTVTISDCSLAGKLIQNKRSRSGITFEYSTEPYKISLNRLKIAGFAKSIHIEEVAQTNVNLNQVHMSEFNIGIANVLNDKSIINVTGSTIKAGMGDGNESGDVLSFLNYQSQAKVYVDNSYLDFNGRKEAYQSAVGLVRVQNSTINAHQTNFFFADGSTAFNNCTFIGFGGRGKSFYSNTGQGIYQISNCKFQQGLPIHANNEKLTLRITGSKS